MRNFSPMARHFIEAGLDQLGVPEARKAWDRWATDNPYQVAEGALNQAQVPLPKGVARAVLAALQKLEKQIRHNLAEQKLEREAVIALHNDLSFIKDVESEVYDDQRELA